ncbi:hypothetical protein C7H79_06335 [Nitrosomonas supralitoralis]|uniref:Uncharacterized protein n=1 Tax=Nitrosomonas supralitoralis TaxID=2116706 RepID=A0A2P7NW88_9PROT|nr:hypothetical protein C7H79_06335 [Nitrosomonas supralitoralis]
MIRNKNDSNLVNFEGYKQFLIEVTKYDPEVVYTSAESILTGNERWKRQVAIVISGMLGILSAVEKCLLHKEYFKRFRWNCLK